MFLFSEAISKLGLVELPLLDRQFTWTNKTKPTFVGKGRLVFTSSGWTVKYPNSVVKSLIMEISDHWLVLLK
jgi:hypothetical protein